MNFIKISTGLLATAAMLYGCKGTSKTTTEVRNLPEIEVTSTKEEPKGTYKAAYVRRNDLIHTKLDIRFDWAKRHGIGKAWLTMKPMFYATDSLELDAKGFDIKKVTLWKSEGNESPLTYKYDGEKLKISLGRLFSRNEEYIVHIDYVAKPEEQPVGGSAAITSDKGLYFINHDGADPGKPRQIWTQGETEASSKWFPTVDKPNERCTQEIAMTVEDKYQTLSNGLKTKSVKNNDGTRTDTWVMDKPHAPYLFMMTVGEFTVVEDVWKYKDGTSIPVYYYVEPKYGKFAKEIYNHTPEMLTFFSDVLGVKYPWPKMAHVIVRDYVSGAMENTSAIIYGDFCQKDDRELEEDHNDGIVAHETFHHWFGDLVTCESWSNLPLNESFANYSEYLWLEHKYGKDEADMHLDDDLGGYMQQAKNSRHPLINYYYDNKEDMFDQHSYNKGGCTLHQLRSILGDDAFFAGLKHYLTKNAFSDVESHELRMAFEEVTGEDLNWYWNQWFYAEGHPELKVSKKYNDADKTLTLEIEQAQNLSRNPLYRLPLMVDVYENGKATRHPITVDKKENTFTFKVNGEPQWVNVDAKRTLVGEVKFERTKNEFAFQYQQGPNVLDRMEALEKLRDKQKDASKYRDVYENALNDKFWGVRRMALANIHIIDTIGDAKLLDRIAGIAANDPNPKVRIAAWERLTESGKHSYIKQAQGALEKERAYGVIGGALSYIGVVQPKAALAYADKLAALGNSSIIGTIAEMYANSGDVRFLPFFEQNWSKTSGFNQISMMGNYARLLGSGDEATREKGIAKLKAVAMDAGMALYGRFGATDALKKIQGAYNEAKMPEKAKAVQAHIDEIKKWEKNPTLLQYYSSY